MTLTSLSWDEIERLGHELAKQLPAPRPKPTLVSFDYDVLSEATRPLPSDRPALKTARNEFFNWGGDENLDTSQSARWWANRARAFERAGVSIKDVVNEHRAPSWQAASKRLKPIARPPGAMVVAESHVWGAVYVCALARAAAHPVHLVTIDRHHDLGYINPGSEDTREQAVALVELEATCDNWIWGCMQRGWITDVTYVRSDAQWYDEYKHEPPMAEPGLLERVFRCSWSQWNEPRYTDGLLLVRSGAWSPPWMDGGFIDMAEALDQQAVWVDHIADWPKIAGTDPGIIREWLESPT